MVDEGWAKANRAALVRLICAPLRKGTDIHFAHPDESAEVARRNLRTTVAFARRAIEDTAKWTSCRAIFRLRPRACGACSTSCSRTAPIGSDLAFEPAKFVTKATLKKASVSRGGTPMHIVDLEKQLREEWRPGVRPGCGCRRQWRGATRLFEQWCDPGHGAPTICMRSRGAARSRGPGRVWIGDSRVTLTAGQLVVVRAGHKHGFQHRASTLHITSTLAAPVFEAAYDDKRESHGAGAARLAQNGQSMINATLDDDLRNAIRNIPDYPKPGIIFRDSPNTASWATRAFRRAVERAGAALGRH